MLDGKKLILSTQQYAKEIRWKSWYHLSTTLIVFAGLYTGIFLQIHVALSLFLSIVLAFNLVRMFAIYHDYLHKSILQHSILAKVLFTFYGMYILAPVSIWKRSHDYHHKHNCKLYTSNFGSFPIATKKEYLAASRSERFWYLFIRHPLTILFGYLFSFIYGMCINAFISSPKKHWDCLIALFVHAGFGWLIFYLTGWHGLVFGFLVPAFVSSALGAYLFYVQHNFPGVTFQTKEEWSYITAALDSSSYLKMNPILQWFTANIGYHHIHHANARIPFYRLPEAYQAFPEFQKPKTVTFSLMDIWRSFQLKVWDGESNRMIGLKEL